MDTDIKKLKIGVLAIVLNERYWQYAKPMIESARKHFLTNHQVDFFLWSDMPENPDGATVFPTEPVEWPLPTLLRYHLFLQQEEVLSQYDYLFYIDVDMLFVGDVGSEVLGEGLTATQHPMYALRHNYIAPYDLNPDSQAYIKVPKHYFAGGFQGGKTQEFFKAMRVMRERIDKDLMKNYIARWNDESHWNKYLFENPPSVVLTPSYIYPDSLIEEYYVKLWGRNYEPKIITLTKLFTISKEGGDAIREQLKTL